MNPTVTQSKDKKRLSWKIRFWAIIKYEMLWNLRKKKLAGLLLVAIAMVAASLMFPGLISPINSISAEANKNPNFATGITIGKFGFFFFALITAMNVFSGEFESSTIIPLLAKPVSRTTIFLGKLFAALLTLVLAYGVFFGCTTVGSIFAYGPQNNLHLVPVAFLGDLFTTFFWVAMVMAFGSLSKNTILTVLATFSLFIALTVAIPVAVHSSLQTSTELNYLPGYGAVGTTYVNVTFTQFYGNGSAMQNFTALWARSIPTGTDYITPNLMNYFLDPNGNVTFINVTMSSVAVPGESALDNILYTEPTSLIPLRAIAVDLIYSLAFLSVAWYAFKRAQIPD